MKFTLLYPKKGAKKDTIYLRHRFSFQGKAKEIKIKTGFEIEREYWDDVNECWDISLKVKSPRKAEDKIRNGEIDRFNADFGVFKLKIEEYLNENPYPSQEDIKNFIYEDKHPKPLKNHSDSGYPENFSDFIDFYIEEKSKLIVGKQKPISIRSVQRYRQIQQKVNKYYPKLKITEIDDDFRDSYSSLMLKLDYKQSFIIKELSFIKMFCRFANKKLDVSKDVLYWEFVDTDKNKFLDPIFSFEEINLLKNTTMPHDYLDNARDWLLISCYTGQRVSDLLKMNSSLIIEDEFYTVHQQKGQKDVTIWLMPDVIDILNKRGGEFPRKISSQRYNEYIKQVCRIAGIDEVMKGGKQINNRKVIGDYPKHELITSHIGRRTFVSLFQPLLGNENTRTQTGHTTDKMLVLYNKTQAIDKAKRVKEAFIKATNKPE